MPWIWIMAALFAVWETAYFGHNSFPKSDAEVIADGMVLILAALAIVAGRLERR